MPLNVKTTSVLPSKTPYGPGIGSAARAVRQWTLPGVEEVAKGFEALLNRVDSLDKTLRNAAPSVTQILVTDAAGQVIAALGDLIYQGESYTNYFSEIHAGDPLMTRDPADAVFNANADGSVTVGENGWLDVLDPYGADAAWIGTQFDVQDVVGATASPTTPLIRLEITGHTLATGDVVRVLNVGGVPNATGIRTVTKIDANHVDLQSTVFIGPYTSGGTVDRLMHITGAVNNGSGLIRLTVTAHGYESGDKVNVQGVGGVAAATGQWIITVVTANTFDLEGSTFSGTYTSGGTSLRYFAGGLFQTIAIGPSFVGYKLRLFADGSLKIKDAEITLTSGGSTIIIDPTDGSFTSESSGHQLRIDSGSMNVNSGAGAAPYTIVDNGMVLIVGDLTNLYGASIASGTGTSSLSIGGDISSDSRQIFLAGFSGSTSEGPQITLTQYRGTGSSPTATQSGDRLGRIAAYGYDGSGENTSPAGIAFVATEAHGLTAHGSLVRFYVTPNGSTVPAISVVFDQSGFAGFGGNSTPGYEVDVTGDINASGIFRNGGTAGLSTTRNLGASLSVNTSATGVFGTPGVGQSNGTVVIGVTLNLTANTFSGGILTA
jgi:hypothetical protein